MLQTPYYLIDQKALLDNLQKIDVLRSESGAKVLLALKCFATWSVFDLLRAHLDGTTSSSQFEVQLGREKFGGETHAYSVAYADHEIDSVIRDADKIIFNSISQLHRFAGRAGHRPCGLRLNPGVSSSSYDLADPARPYSRLGERDPAAVAAVIDRIDGFMIHNNCENRDFDRFDALLDEAESRFGELFAKVNWVSLGGGIHFTSKGYPLEKLGKRLRAFSERYRVQVYLEPGEAVVSQTTTLEVSVLDVLDNGKRLAIVDSSIEAHMPDLLVYGLHASVQPNHGDFSYMVCGNSCLAGDVFGEFRFPEPLVPGSRLSIQDAAAYTMVKKNWFNGVRMPSIAVRDIDGSVRVVREFDFGDYAASLS